MTTVAVAVTGFTCGDFLSEAIGSVLSQTDQDWRCAVVYDPTEHDRVVRLFCEMDSRIVAVPSPRVDVSSARNIAFSVASGALMIALDGDDRICPGYVSGLRAAMEPHEVRVAYSGTRYVGIQEGLKREVPYSRRTLAIRNMIVSAAMFRRVDFDLVRGYDAHPDNHYEDWELWVAILKQGGEVAFLDTPLFVYRQWAGSRGRSMTLAQIRAGREYIFSKHRDFCWHAPTSNMFPDSDA